MVDVILGSIALGVAVPGVVVSFAEGGRYLKKKVDQYKNAPSAAVELGRFGSELHSGQLKENIALAAWPYSQDDVDDGVKNALEDQIERLRSGLTAADKQLESCFDVDGRLKRVKFFCFGERNLRAVISELERWQRSFFHVVSLIEMRRRVLPDPFLLTSEKFKTVTRTDGEYCHRIATNSHVWVAKGQVIDEKLREANVIIERPRKITTGVNEVKEIASCLRRQSAAETMPQGILKCLGYREKPKLELIFELPLGKSQLRTMENLIQGDQGHGYCGRRSLDSRYILARRISEAVLAVHTSNRVHKNIRPDTILMVKSETNAAADGLNFGNPYLTDWTMLRKIDSPSSMVGENDWLNDIYRHPRRQGLQPEDRYNMGHDIYSLGVNLLVIGLWEPLIIIDSGIKLPSDKYREKAVKLSLVQAEVMAAYEKAQDDTRAQNARRLLKALTKPLVMQQTLQGMAGEELPSRMGLKYTAVVISCLSCLEGGFEDPKVFEETRKQAVGIEFSSKVLQPLSSLEELFRSLP